MDTNTINVKSSNQNVSAIKPIHDKEDSKISEEKNEISQSAAATAKEQLNAAIINSSLELSLKSGDKALSLVYKAALEGINEALQGELGDNAIQDVYDSGIDMSPEATADRIVSLSTAFFGQYKEQNPELSEEDAAIKFTEIIKGGIDTGFGEAREILEGLSVLEGDIASNIDKTYDLVQKGLQDFLGLYTSEEQEQ